MVRLKDVLLDMKEYICKKYCVGQKENILGNQQPYLIMCPPYLHFYPRYHMSTFLGSRCLKELVHQPNSFEETRFVALRMDVNKNQN